MSRSFRLPGHNPPLNTSGVTRELVPSNPLPPIGNQGRSQSARLDSLPSISGNSLQQVLISLNAIHTKLDNLEQRVAGIERNQHKILESLSIIPTSIPKNEPVRVVYYGKPTQ
jgi:hypothetical protein